MYTDRNLNNMTSIVTRTGDNGQTDIVGGKRLSKSDPRIHAYGTVDELNALLGSIASQKLPTEMQTHIVALQHLLFRVGSDLATPLDSDITVPRIEQKHIETLDGWITELEPTLPPLTSFILPSGSAIGSQLHLARTVCRRAERFTVELQEHEDVNANCVIFLNRLSDLLFLLARQMNQELGEEEIKVNYEE